MLQPDQKKKLDSNIRKMLDSGASQEDVTQYAKDFVGKFSDTKKKSTATSPSPKQESVSSGPETTSLVGVNNNLNPLAVKSGLEVDMKSPVSKEGKSNKKTDTNTPSQYKEGSMAWNLDKLSKTKDYIALNEEYKKNTELTPDELESVKKEVSDEINGVGLWNTINKKGKEIYNAISENVPSFLRPGIGDKIETDVLASEKKEAETLLKRKGYKPSQINNELITNTAKQLKLQKAIDSKKESKRREYLSNAEDEYNLNESNLSKKDKLEFQEKMTVAGKQQQKTHHEKIIDLKDNVTLSRRSNLEKLNTQAESLQKQGKPIPDELKQQFQSEYQEYQKSIQETIQAREDYLRTDNELKDAKTNLDYFKRDYSKMNNLLGNLVSSGAKIDEGIFGAVDWALEAKQNVFGRNGWDESIQNLARNEAKGMTKLSEDVSGSIMKPIKVDDIHTINDAGRWFNQLVGQQAPIYMATATGAPGIIGLGITSTGQQYTQMYNEMHPENPEPGQMIPQYNAWQMGIVPLGYGATETASALVTHFNMKNAARIYQSATEPERKLFVDGFIKGSLHKGGDLIKGGGLEFGDESLTQVGQNWLDKNLLGKDVQLLDNVKDVGTAGGVMGLLLPGMSHIVTQATKPFSTDNKIQKVSREILSLQSQLDQASTEENKQTISNQIKAKQEEVTGLLKKNISNMESLSNEQFQEILSLEKAQQNIRNQAVSIKADTNISDEMSNQILGNLNAEFKANEARRKELLSGNASVTLERLVDGDQKEIIRLKDAAQRELIKELNPDGTKDVKLDDTQISKKAIQILNKEKSTATNREEPVAEVRNNEQEVDSEPAPVSENDNSQQFELPPAPDNYDIVSGNDGFDSTNKQTTNETAPANNPELNGSIQPGVTSMEQNGTTEQQSNPTENVSETVNSGAVESNNEVNQNVKKVKSLKGATYDVHFDEQGLVSKIISPKDGREIPKFRKVEKTVIDPVTKQPKKITVLQKNANYSRIEADATGGITNNKAKEERVAKINDAVKNFEPSNEYEAALHYFATGGGVNTDSAKKETGTRGKEVKWATNFKKNETLPSVERASEIISEGTGLDQQEVRNALIDIIREKKNVSEVKDEVVSLSEEKNAKLQAEEARAFENSLSEQELAIYKSQTAEDSYIAELTDEEAIKYFEEYYEQKTAEYYEQRGQSTTNEPSRTTETTSVQERVGEKETTTEPESAESREKRRVELHERNQDLAEKNIEERKEINKANEDWVKENEEALVEAYLENRKSDDKKKNKIDPDAIRDLFEDFGYTGSNVPNFLDATNYLTNVIYDKLLSETENKTITVLTGVGGSGKSHATGENGISELNLGAEGIVFDSALNDIGSLSSVVQKAVDAGFKVRVVPVYADPVTAFKRTIIRGFKENRWLSGDYFTYAFGTNAGKLFEFRKKFPNLEVVPIFNEGTTEKVSFNDALRWNYKLSDEQGLEILKEIENAINRKNISDAAVAAIGTDIQGIRSRISNWSSEMGAITDRINDRVSDVRERQAQSRLETSGSGVPSGLLRVNEQSNEILNKKVDKDNLKSALDFLDGFKLNPNSTNATLPFLPQTWNLFIEALKAAVTAGHTIAEAINIASEKLKAQGISLNEIQQIVDTFTKKATTKLQQTNGDFVRKKGVSSVLSRLNNKENSKEVLDSIEKLGLNYQTRKQEKVYSDAVNFVDSVGIFEAYNAIKSGKITHGDTAAVIYSQILNNFAKEVSNVVDELTDEKEIQEAIDKLTAFQEDVLREYSALATMAGQTASIFNLIYLKDQTVKYSLSKQIEYHKSINHGEISPETEAKFKELDAKYQDAIKRIGELEEQHKQMVAQQNFDNIIEEVRRKAPRDLKPNSAKAKEIANKIRKFKIEPPKGLRSSVGADLVYNAAVEAIAVSFEQSGKVADAIAAGLKVIKQSDWYKSLNDSDKNTVDKDFTNNAYSMFVGNINITKDGKVKVPTQTIVNFINEGGTDVNELVKQLKKEIQDEYPEVSERQIRDAISGYGSKANKTKSQLLKDISKLKRIAKLESVLEDVQNGIRKAKNESKKRELSEEEAELKRQIKQLNDDLGFTEEDRTKRAENYTKKRIAEIKEKIRNKDFSKKEVKPIEESEELKALRIEKNRIQEQYDYLNYMQEIKNRNFGEKLKDFVSNLWDAQRVTLATGELSFVGLQGGFYMVDATFSRKTFKKLVANFKGTTTEDWAKRPLKTISKIVKSAHSAEATIEMFNKMGNKNNYEDFQAALKDHEYYDVFLKSGLRILGEDVKNQVREDMFIGNNILNILKIPIVQLTKLDKNRKRTTVQGYYEKLRTGKVSDKNKKTATEIFDAANPLSVFERGNNTFMNLARVELFMRGVKALEMQGKNPTDNLQDFKDLASVVNTSTGSANLSKSLTMALPVLNKLFFSVRLWGSALNMTPPFSILYFMRMGNYDNVNFSDVKSWKNLELSVAQKTFMRTTMKGMLASYGLATMTVLLINSALDDDDEMDDEEKESKRAYIETDPRSSNFGQVVSGDLRMDYFGPVRGNIVLFSKLITRQTKRKDGELVSNGDGFFNRTNFEIATSFISNKLNPFPGMFAKNAQGKSTDVYDSETGESEKRTVLDFGGDYAEDVTLKTQVQNNFIPIFYKGIQDVYDEDPALGAEFHLMMSFMGKQSNVYGGKTSIESNGNDNYQFAKDKKEDE